MRPFSFLLVCALVLATAVLVLRPGLSGSATFVRVSDNEARSILGGVPRPSCFGNYNFSPNGGCTLFGCTAAATFLLCQAGCTYPNQNPIQGGTCFDGFNNPCGTVTTAIQSCVPNPP
jgi:hypothetical protein